MLEKAIAYLSHGSDKYPLGHHALYSSILDCFNTGVANVLSFPLAVGYKITKKCNLACQFCWADKTGKEPEEKKIFATLSKLIKKNVLEFTFSGGEPLLSPIISDLVCILKNEKRAIRLYTNGTLIRQNPELFEKFNRLTDYVQVSFDAHTEKLFKAIRKDKSFNNILLGVKLLKEMKIPFRLHMTVMKGNVKYLYDVFRQAEKLGATVFSVGIVSPMNLGSTFYNDISSAVFDDYLYGVFQCISYTSNTYFEFFLPYYLLWKYSAIFLKKNAQKMKPVRIDEGNVFIHINADGDVYPSNYMSEEIVRFSNIYNEPFSKLEASYQKSIFRNARIINDPICCKCSISSVCQGGDYFAVIKNSNDIGKGDPDCPMHIKPL